MSIVDSIDEYSFSLRPNISQWSAKANEQGEYQLVYKPSSFGGLCQNRLATAEGGPYRALQLADKVCGLLSFVGFESQFKAAGKIFNGGWTMTVIPHLPSAFQFAKSAVSNLMTREATDLLPGFFRRKCVSAIQEVSTFVSSAGYASLPFLSLSEKTQSLGSSVLKTAEIATIATDVCDLQKSAEDLSKARFIEKRAEVLSVSPELVNALKATTKLHLLRTAKAACSVSGFVLGTGLAAAGVSKLRGSLALMSVVSVVGTLISTGAGIYKEGMKYKPVDFFDSKQVQYIAKSA